MAERWFRAGWLAAALAWSGAADTTVAQAPAAPAPSLGAEMARRLAEYHAEAPDNQERLRLVYFHPADLPPQPDYEARLGRIMRDIQEFYRGEMVRLGFADRPLRLPERNGQVALEVLAGKEPKTEYDYQSGGKIRRELADRVDFDQDFVLIFGGMCEREAPGVYRVFSPYYGLGADQRHGLCFAADVEVLDTRNLGETAESVTYIEHSGRFTRTVAAFNSLYIGGIAHELGHGLSLPHNRETKRDRAERGIALMGSGNYSYRNNVWGGGRGSFLTLASAVRLAAHPLFTYSDRDRNVRPACQISALDCKATDAGVTISGSVRSNLEPLAVIAYTDPEGGSDYDAHPWVSLVNDGKFAMEVTEHRGGPHELRLVVVHANGAAVTAKRLLYTAAADGRVEPAALLAQEKLAQIEQLVFAGQAAEALAAAEQILAATPATPIAAQLRHLPTVLAPPVPVALASVQGDNASLSAAAWESAKVGWGAPARNAYCRDRGLRDAVFLSLGQRFYAQGLYAHCPSRYVFDLGGKWKELTVDCGIQDGGYGSAVFRIVGDGTVLAESPLLKAGPAHPLTATVTGVRTLELIAEPGPAGNGGSWSIWGNPIVRR